MAPEHGSPGKPGQGRAGGKGGGGRDAAAGSDAAGGKDSTSSKGRTMGDDPGAGGAEGGPDLMAFAQALGKELQQVGKQFKAVFDQAAEDAQYRFDQELAKALAKQPELYAEVRKTLRQIKRTADKAAEALGLEKDK